MKYHDAYIFVFTPFHDRNNGHHLCPKKAEGGVRAICADSNLISFATMFSVVVDTFSKKLLKFL